jgi:hypothetical protein
MGDTEHCNKHNVNFPSKYWCPMCLEDEMDADMEKRELGAELDTGE